MPAIRLQHASVQVPEELLDACGDFSERVIVMQRIPILAGRARFRFGDGDHVHLPGGPGTAASTAHLAVQADDVDATTGRCPTFGAVPRRDRIWGTPRWFMRDPAGDLVELFAAPTPDPA